MGFDDDLRAVFGDRTAHFTDDHRQMLRRLWEGGRSRGREERATHFDQGRIAGLQELGVFFTRVLAKRPMHLVFTGSSSALEFQPWARAALQQVLDAPDLEEASRVASDLGQLETDELMRRFGQAPPPESEELKIAFDREKRKLKKLEQEDELALLQRMWERGDEEEMRQAHEEFQKRSRRRR